MSAARVTIKGPMDISGKCLGFVCSQAKILRRADPITHPGSSIDLALVRGCQGRAAPGDMSMGELAGHAVARE